MAYRLPGNEAKAAIEIYPVSGNKLTGAATGMGLAALAIPTLLVVSAIVCAILCARPGLLSP
jgi:hypothetical protein